MRIGTRSSRLAQWQAEWVQARLGIPSELVVIQTTGDEKTEVPLQASEGIGFFTKELEEALLANEIDLAVHSLKDLPTRQPEGLALAAIPERGAVNDVLLLRPDAHEPEQPLGIRPGATIGTSSNRRAFQLRTIQPDLSVAVIRGNIPTRIEKLTKRKREFDGIVMAQTALDRLGRETLKLGKLIEVPLLAETILPAPGQGALGIECRGADTESRGAVEKLTHPLTARAVTLERDLLAALGSGCNAPLGAYAQVAHPSQWLFEAVHYTPEGSRFVRTSVLGPDPAYLLRAALADFAPLSETLPARGPLAGLTVLNTRPRGRGGQLTRALLHAGASVWVQPQIQTVTRVLPAKERTMLEQAREYDLAIVSSPAAVEHACDAMDWRGKLRAGQPAAVVTIGAATKEAVVEGGWRVEGYPRRGHTDSLLDFLEDRELIVPGYRVLYLRALEGSDEAPDALAQEGLEVDLVCPYETLAERLPPLPELPRVDVITFTSPSGVTSFLETNPWRPGWIALAIGPTTAEACTDAELKPLVVADEPAPEAMLKALTDYFALQPAKSPLAGI